MYLSDGWLDHDFHFGKVKKAWTMIWNVTSHMPCITIDFGYGTHFGDASFILSHVVQPLYPNPKSDLRILSMAISGT